MRKIVPRLKAGDKVTEYSEGSGVRRIGVVKSRSCDGWYFVQYPGVKFEITYRMSTLREACSYVHGRYVHYIRPYINGDEHRAAVTARKSHLWLECRGVVDKITTMEQCEELKRIFEEIKKEYEDAKKQEND